MFLDRERQDRLISVSFIACAAKTSWVVIFKVNGVLRKLKHVLKLGIFLEFRNRHVWLRSHVGKVMSPIGSSFWLCSRAVLKYACSSFAYSVRMNSLFLIHFSWSRFFQLGGQNRLTGSVAFPRRRLICQSARPVRASLSDWTKYCRSPPPASPSPSRCSRNRSAILLPPRNTRASPE